MKSITVYDTEAEVLNEIADANNVTTQEIIEQLIDYLDEVKEFNGWS